MLRKYLRDPEHKIDLEPITVQQDLTVECHPVHILDSSERIMRRRTIKYVKVLWSNQSEREATWELEEHMRTKFPKLFEAGEFYKVKVLHYAYHYHRKTEFEDEFF